MNKSKLIFNVTKIDYPNGIARVAGLLKFFFPDGTFKAFDCLSGGDHNGALPPGSYLVGKLIRLDNKKNNAPYKGSKHVWFAPLTPQFQCMRAGLGIHPRRSNFTYGCEGINKMCDEELFQLLDGYFKTFTDPLLNEVVYSIQRSNK